MPSHPPDRSDLDAEYSLLREQTMRIEAEVAKRTEALRKSEAMLAESQRLAKIGSFELEIATRRLTWSAQQYRNFGLAPRPEIERALVITRIDPRDLARHEAVVERAIAYGEAFAMDYRVMHPDGTVLTMHTIGRPVPDAAGRIVKLVGTSQDVTERTRMQEQLRAQYETLMQLDELKRNFVGPVTHEFRTPLTTILGYAAPLSPLAERALQVIAARFREPIGLSELSAELGYSAAYLTNTLRVETGKTVLQWIIHHRLEAAKRLMSETNWSGQQIAQAVGYTHYSHFLRQFRQAHGVPPSAWRDPGKTT